MLDSIAPHNPQLASKPASTGPQSWFETALSFFYPEVCQSCEQQRAGKAESYLCANCRKQLLLVESPICSQCGHPIHGAVTPPLICGACVNDPPDYDWARAAVVANEWMLKLIHAYKYHRAMWFEPYFVGLLLQSALPALADGTWDMIVPVPLHSRKRREREFNQAEHLARALSQAIGVPLNAQALRRVEYGRSQTQLSREERVENAKRVFAAGSAQVSGAQVLLIDDVMTTGATTSACARVLKSRGAQTVGVWTLARAVM